MHISRFQVYFWDTWVKTDIILNINESEFDLSLPGISPAEIYHRNQLKITPLASSLEDEDNTEREENEPKDVNTH